MPDTIWTKTKAEFVIEMIHEHFGRKRDWELATAPARKGTPRRAEFDRMIEVLAGGHWLHPGRFKSYALRGYRPHLARRSERSQMDVLDHWQGA
jgi:hypothetical protein